MKVIILAGGMGTRLKTVVNNVPKPMADIDGMPFLELLIYNLINHGADEFFLCVSYMKEKIIQYFGNQYRGCKISYSLESEPLGTGGAIKRVFENYEIEDAIIVNGDTFVKMNYNLFYNQNKSFNLAIALRKEKDVSRYGSVKVTDKYIYRFSEKNSNTTGYINAGVYFVNNRLLQFFPQKKVFSFEKEFLETYVTYQSTPYYLVDDYFIDIGIPESYYLACKELKYVIGLRNKALFLDRDGVINFDKNHMYKIEDCEFIPGIFDFCLAAKHRGYKIIVVTNQAGIAKGLYSEEDYFKLREYIHNIFKKNGCSIDGEYYCPYHPEGIGKYKINSYDRKPNPGMLFKAMNDFNIDMNESLLIGDNITDIEAAKKAGVKKYFMIQADQPLNLGELLCLL